jgi:hypothetical protein
MKKREGRRKDKEEEKRRMKKREGRRKEKEEEKRRKKKKGWDGRKD